jgi:hypothetical protein
MRAKEVHMPKASSSLKMSYDCRDKPPSRKKMLPKDGMHNKTHAEKGSEPLSNRLPKAHAHKNK